MLGAAWSKVTTEVQPLAAAEHAMSRSARLYAIGDVYRRATLARKIPALCQRRAVAVMQPSSGTQPRVQATASVGPGCSPKMSRATCVRPSSAVSMSYGEDAQTADECRAIDTRWYGHGVKLKRENCRPRLLAPLASTDSLFKSWSPKAVLGSIRESKQEHEVILDKPGIQGR